MNGVRRNTERGAERGDGVPAGDAPGGVQPPSQSFGEPRLGSQSGGGGPPPTWGLEQRLGRVLATGVAISAAHETANFDAIITPMLAANPDVLFFSGLYNQAGVFFKQARDAGYEGTFMGTDGMDASGLADLAGDSLVKGGGMVYTSVGGPASAYPKAAKFAADFKAKFGADPQPFAAQGYDSATVCLKAIENAAKAANGEIPTREAVRDAIRALTVEGLTGTISFDSIGDLPTAKYFIIKVNATSGDTWNTNEIVAELDFASPGMGK